MTFEIFEIDTKYSLIANFIINTYDPIIHKYYCNRTPKRHNNNGKDQFEKHNACFQIVPMTNEPKQRDTIGGFHDGVM